jgi:hypothetical protein
VAPPSLKVVVVEIVNVDDVPSCPVTVTDVGVTAVTTPPNLMARAALMSMLVAVVVAVDNVWMST